MDITNTSAGIRKLLRISEIINDKGNLLAILLSAREIVWGGRSWHQGRGRHAGRMGGHPYAGCAELPISLQHFPEGLTLSSLSGNANVSCWGLPPRRQSSQGHALESRAWWAPSWAAGSKGIGSSSSQTALCKTWRGEKGLQGTHRFVQNIKFYL